MIFWPQGLGAPEEVSFAAVARGSGLDGLWPRFH